jgi:large subunit ribosomal protein L1
LVEKTTLAAVKEVLEKSPKRNFRETVDLSINLKDVDLSIPKNRIQEDVILPHGRGRQIKVAVIGSGELALKAKSLADKVITPEELGTMADDRKSAKKVANEMDFFIAEAPLMPTVGKRLGIVLAPRGKMPKPIAQGADPKLMIENLRKTVSVRSKDKMTFHMSIGTTEMTPEQLAENIELVLKRISAKLEKGMMNFRSVYVKTTMGPSKKIM